VCFHRGVPEAPPITTGGFDPFEQHLVAGSEHLRHSRLAEAQRAFLAALEVQPGHPKALALLGLTYFRAGRYDDARPVYEELVRALPSDASHHLNLGLVYLKIGDAEHAIGELEQSRDLDPSQSRAVSYLGLAYARAGRFREAYAAFVKAGQADLAREVEKHLTADEKAEIDATLHPPVAADAQPSVSARFVAPPAEVVAAAAPAPAPAEAAAAPAPAPAPADDADDAAFAEPPAFAAPAAPAAPAPADDEIAEIDADDVVEVAEPPPPQPGTPRARTRAQTAISRAVAQAVPSAAVAGSGTRVAAGARPPQPLSELATSRLVRPEDGDHPFEVSATGVLVVRVDGKIYTRTEGVDVTGGHLVYEPAHRRARGRDTDEPFSSDGRAMFVVSGNGHLIASPLGGQFTAVQLDDDIFYLREDLVFAFERQVRWENGHVPGSRAQLLMVQFRGSGAVAFRTDHPLLAVKLAPERVLYVDAHALAGWIGRVVPRGVQAAGAAGTSELFVECTGEGVVLIQEETAPPPRTAPAVGAP
jgi:Tetratricopeptide repeat/Mitochondrial biogenesis AIM24